MTDYQWILWFKAMHLIFMVAWFAGIFYLPRIFVYHAETSEPVIHEQFKVMERRLLFFVTPFALLTLVFGFLIIGKYGAGYLAMSTWMQIKLVLIALLVLYHAYCFRLLYLFKHDRNTRSGRWYRVFNEVPVLLLFAIIILAVIKPSF